MGDAVSSSPIQLPGAPTSNLEASTKKYVDDKDALKVSIGGDTMTGALLLDVSAPPGPTEAVSADWVNNNFNGGIGVVAATNVEVTPAGDISSTDAQDAFEELDTKKIPVAGGTMTGPLILSGPPTTNLQAATKAYVDKFGTFAYHQSSSATTWTIVHNLGRFPSVTIVDDNGNIAYVDVVYNSYNTITISVNPSLSGWAYLN